MDGQAACGWLTMTDVAKAFGRSRAWAHKQRERGRFPNVTRLYGLYLVPQSDVLTLSDSLGKRLHTLA